MPENSKNEIKRGAGILFLCTEDNSILLLLRSGNKNTGLWDLPGGHTDPGENFITTAKRETIEELGTLPNQARFISSLLNVNNGHAYKIYIFGLTLDQKNKLISEIKLDDEHSNYQWFKTGALPFDKLHPSLNILKI